MLGAMFKAQFVDRKVVPTTYASLKFVQQGENETLQKFTKRFTVATTSILNLTPTLIMHSLIYGLQLEPFSYPLFKKQPENMDALKEQAAKYIAYKFK